MPTYQYACTACSHQLEAVQSFTDDPLTDCPACEGRLRKLFGSVGVVFKGSGFYRTDSRAAASGSNANGKADSGKAEGGTSESGKKAGSSGDSGTGGASSGSDSSGSARKETSSSGSSSTKTAAGSS